MAIFINVDSYGQETATLIATYSTAIYDNEVKYIYQKILSQPLSLCEKTDQVSRYFMGTKYSLGALGEGPEGIYDMNPLYRTDAFDCLTYVSTVLALVEAANCEEFIRTLKKIHYYNAKVSYFNRYHFTEADWNVENKNNHFIRDITAQVSPHYLIAKALIDKPNWYRCRTKQALKSITSLSKSQSERLLQEIHQHGKQTTTYMARTSYIPLTEIIHSPAILECIPSGTIVEIVDQTHDFKKKIGSDLNIVHLGFAIKTQQGLMFRHASKVHHQVTEVLLIQYLQRSCALSEQPWKIGIHLEAIILPCRGKTK